MVNWLSTLNALALFIIYLYILGDRIGFITNEFSIILVPILIMGIIIELYFFLKGVARKK